MKQSPLFGISALFAAVALGLTGCDKPAAPTDTADKAPTDHTTKAGAVIDRNTADLAPVQEVSIDNSAEPESLDPHKVSGVPESNLIRQMFVGLVSTDIDGKTIGGMAESWDNKDNLVWTFKLRDAKWSNGDPVTAQDFVYSWQRLIDPATASPYASYLDDARVLNAKEIMDGKAKPSELGVRAIDDKTFEVTLSEPVPYFADMLIHTSVKPVHKATVEKFGEKWTDPANIVVNGPYKLTAWQVNDRITMDRNSAYYDDANTKINRVHFLPITDDVASYNRFKTGELDVGHIPIEQFTVAKTEIGDQLKVRPSLCVYYYEMNNQKPPFNDPRVREAFKLATDRETIANKILAQGQMPAYQLTPPAVNGNVKFTPEWQSLDRAKRLERARQLLTEAGYGDAKPLKFDMLYNTSESHKKIAVAAASFWQEIMPSVKVNLVNQEWKTYLDTKQAGNFQMARAGWCADYNEASSFLNTFKSNNSNNYGHYKNENYDALLLKTLQPAVSDDQRSALYIEAEKTLDADSGTIPIYHYVAVSAVKPYVLNYTGNDALDNYQVKDWAIAKH